MSAVPLSRPWSDVDGSRPVRSGRIVEENHRFTCNVDVINKENRLEF